MKITSNTAKNHKKVVLPTSHNQYGCDRQATIVGRQSTTIGNDRRAVAKLFLVQRGEKSSKGNFAYFLVQVFHFAATAYNFEKNLKIIFRVCSKCTAVSKQQILTDCCADFNLGLKFVQVKHTPLGMKHNWNPGVLSFECTL